MKDFKQVSVSATCAEYSPRGIRLPACGAIFDVVSNFFNDRQADPQKAAQANWRPPRGGVRKVPGAWSPPVDLRIVCAAELRSGFRIARKRMAN